MTTTATTYKARKVQDDTQRSDADRVPIKVQYDRRIRPDWSEPGQDGFNLSREIADIRSRPELVQEDESAFLRFLLSKHVIRRNLQTGQEEVWLAPLQSRRLQRIVNRHVDPGYEAAWHRRQQERQQERTNAEGLGRTVEGVAEDGRWQLQTCRL